MHHSEVQISPLSRLYELKLTTLLERRMRGDLIETFKVVNGHVNYGSNLFGHSRTGRHLVARACTSKLTNNKRDFFAQRVLKYWNKLPGNIRNSPTVNSFKIDWMVSGKKVLTHIVPVSPICDG